MAGYLLLSHLLFLSIIDRNCSSVTLSLFHHHFSVFATIFSQRDAKKWENFRKTSSAVRNLTDGSTPPFVNHLIREQRIHSIRIYALYTLYLRRHENPSHHTTGYTLPAHLSHPPIQLLDGGSCCSHIVLVPTKNRMTCLAFEIAAGSSSDRRSSEPASAAGFGGRSMRHPTRSSSNRWRGLRRSFISFVQRLRPCWRTLVSRSELGERSDAFLSLQILAISAGSRGDEVWWHDKASWHATK